MNTVTIGKKKDIEEILSNPYVELVSELLYEGKRNNHQFEIGEELILHGLEEYPEFNGEVVTVVAYRDKQIFDDHLSYYISSKSGNVEPYLNFVWEMRLRRE